VTCTDAAGRDPSHLWRGVERVGRNANFFDQALGPAVGGVVNDISAELAANAIGAQEAAELVKEAVDDSL